MTQKTIKVFVVAIYPKTAKKIFVTNKTDVYHTDDFWSSDILDLKNYGNKNNRFYR